VWDKQKTKQNKTKQNKKKKKQQNHAREGVGSEGTDGLPAAVLRKDCDTFKICMWATRTRRCLRDREAVESKKRKRKRRRKGTEKRVKQEVSKKHQPVVFANPKSVIFIRGMPSLMSTKMFSGCFYLFIYLFIIFFGEAMQ